MIAVARTSVIPFFPKPVGILLLACILLCPLLAHAAPPRINLQVKKAEKGDVFEDPSKRNSFSFEVVAVDELDGPIEVRYHVTDSYINPADATDVDLGAGKVTLTPNEDRVNATVHVVDDEIPEGRENVTIQLEKSDAYGSIVDRYEWNIIDDDEGNMSVVSFEAVRDAEEGGTAGAFRISRTGGTNYPIEVEFYLEDLGVGSNTYDPVAMAVPGIDYELFATLNGLPRDSWEFYGTIGMDAGVSELELPIVAIDDEVFDENAENVKITLRAGKAYVLDGELPITREIQIIDNDSSDDSLPLVSAAAETAKVLENSGETVDFVLSRTGNTDEPLSVNFELRGMAVNGVHYQCVMPQTVEFAAGSATARVTVTPIDNETGTCISDFRQRQTSNGLRPVFLDLLPGEGYRVMSPSRAMIQILDRPSDFEDTICLVSDLCASLNPTTVGEKVIFTMITDIAIPGPNEKVDFSMLWDFGDGTTGEFSSGQIEHVYTKPGTYTVTARAIACSTSLGNQRDCDLWPEDLENAGVATQDQVLVRTLELTVGESGAATTSHECGHRIAHEGCDGRRVPEPGTYVNIALPNDPDLPQPDQTLDSEWKNGAPSAGGQASDGGGKNGDSADGSGGGANAAGGNSGSANGDPGESGDGCGCRLAARPSSGLPAAIGGLLLLAAGARRRRLFR